MVTCLEKSNWSDVVEFHFNNISEKKAGSLQKVVTESDNDKRELKEMLNNWLFKVKSYKTQAEVKD